MAITPSMWARRGEDLEGLVHHSDRGGEYLAIRYTERLADAGAVTSVGSCGDSYDNALVEAFHSLYKAELIRKDGPWRGLDDVEVATLNYVAWFNRRRLHGEIGRVPPEEFEAAYYDQLNPAPLVVLNKTCLLGNPQAGLVRAVSPAAHVWHMDGTCHEPGNPPTRLMMGL